MKQIRKLSSRPLWSRTHQRIRNQIGHQLQANIQHLVRNPVTIQLERVRTRVGQEAWIKSAE